MQLVALLEVFKWSLLSLSTFFHWLFVLIFFLLFLLFLLLFVMLVSFFYCYDEIIFSIFAPKKENYFFLKKSIEKSFLIYVCAEEEKEGEEEE